MVESPAPLITPTGLGVSDWLSLVETIALLIGGVWAFYLYRTSRQGEATVGITARTRFLRSDRPSRSLLLVALRFANTSGVVFYVQRARAVLVDASARTPDGRIVLVPFAEQDPFLFLYGEEVEDPERISNGESFRYFEGQEISLEPGESAETQLAFPLGARPGLLAMRVTVDGFQRRGIRPRFWLPTQPYSWSSFFFILPQARRTAAGWEGATIESEAS